MVNLTERDADFIIRYFRREMERYSRMTKSIAADEGHDSGQGIVSQVLGALGPMGNVLGEQVRNRYDDDISMCERCIELLTVGSECTGKEVK